MSEAALSEDDALRKAYEIVKGSSVGLFSTVGPGGEPYSRWMGSISHGSLDHLLTLTAPDSRKVAHVRVHPQVSWLFHTTDYREVVHLFGRARVMDDPVHIKRAWQEIPDKQQAYFLQFQHSGIGFLVLETEVSRVEYTRPRENIYLTCRLNG